MAVQLTDSIGPFNLFLKVIPGAGSQVNVYKGLVTTCPSCGPSPKFQRSPWSSSNPSPWHHREFSWTSRLRHFSKAPRGNSVSCVKNFNFNKKKKKKKKKKQTWKTFSRVTAYG